MDDEKDRCVKEADEVRARRSVSSDPKVDGSGRSAGSTLEIPRPALHGPSSTQDEQASFQRQQRELQQGAFAITPSPEISRRGETSSPDENEEDQNNGEDETPAFSAAVVFDNSTIPNSNIPWAEPASPVDLRPQRKKRLFIGLAALLAFIGIVVAVVTTQVSRRNESVNGNAPNTMAPTPGPCNIEIRAECIVPGSPVQGQSCESFKPDLFVDVEPFDICQSPPTALYFQLNDWDCSISRNTTPSDDPNYFSCVDFFGGPPASEEGVFHILVTDVPGNILFSELLSVGEFFGFNVTDGPKNISISSPTQDIIWQRIRFDIDCSVAPYYGSANILGSLILVGYVNDVQGHVSIFGSVDLDVDVEVPITVDGGDEEIKLTSMLVNTNFAGLVDLTDQVAGQTIPPEGSVPVTMEGTVDWYQERVYIFDFQVEGVRVSDGAPCFGNQTTELIMGSPLPPGAEPVDSPPPTAFPSPP